jgi:uncharacterized protein YjbJ (UPF0337 family)
MESNRHPQAHYNPSDQRLAGRYMADNQPMYPGVKDPNRLETGHQAAQVAAGAPVEKTHYPPQPSSGSYQSTSTTTTTREPPQQTAQQRHAGSERPDLKDKLMAAKDRTVGTIKERLGKLTHNQKMESEGRIQHDQASSRTSKH